jgi:thymidylate synthase
MAGHPDDQYLDLLKRVLDEGYPRQEPGGAGVQAVFAHQMRFDLTRGFPLVTTRRLRGEPVVHGVLAALSDRADRPDAGTPAVPVAAASGLGSRVRGLLDTLAQSPEASGLTLAGWPVVAVDGPGTSLIQVHVGDGQLSSQLYQPSAEAFLDLPYAIAAGALLTHLLAHAAGYLAGEFVLTLGDVHLRDSHLPQVREQLQRKPYPPPRLRLDPAVTDPFALTAAQIAIEGYKAHPPLKTPVTA